MKLQNSRNISKVIIFFVLTLHLSGCASFGPTKPNSPYAGSSHPAVLNKLAQNSPLLVKELGRLPEIQDGISDTEMSALKTIVDLYDNDPTKFEYAFSQMNKIGLPEYRKYCTPLQALFWVAEDRKIDRDIIEKYSLKDLLDTAWNNKESWKTLFTESDKMKIVAGVKGKKLQQQYAVYFRNYDEGTVNTIKYNIKYTPEIFTWSARRTIKNALKRQKTYKVRWNDFSTTMDRLNAPVLVDAYLNYFVHFQRVTGPVNYDHTSPYRVFRMGFAHCLSAGYFGEIALKQAGYKTIKREVRWGNGWSKNAHGGLAVKLDNGNYWLVVDFTTYGNLFSGPYENTDQIDNRLARGQKIKEAIPRFYY